MSQHTDNGTARQQSEAPRTSPSWQHRISSDSAWCEWCACVLINTVSIVSQCSLGSRMAPRRPTHQRPLSQHPKSRPLSKRVGTPPARVAVVCLIFKHRNGRLAHAEWYKSYRRVDQHSGARSRSPHQSALAIIHLRAFGC